MMIVCSDHQDLEYFTTTKVLIWRQARWFQKLAAYDFKNFYRLGSQNGQLDALSWLPKYRPEKEGSEDQPITMILSQKHFSLNKEEAKELISVSKLSKR
jgi:hypothetical protein